MGTGGPPCVTHQGPHLPALASQDLDEFVADIPGGSVTPALADRPEHTIDRAGPASEELAEGHGQLGGVQHAVAVQVEPVEGGRGLLGPAP